MDQLTMIDEPGFIPRLRLRAMDLSLADNEITKANKHKGAAIIDQKFADDLHLNQDNNAYSYELHTERAAEHLARACGNCAIRGCALRGNVDSWIRKYPYADKRHRLIKNAKKDAEEGIETRC